MDIKVKSPYEPLNVEIGDAVVNTRINVTVDGLLDISEACSKAEQKVKHLEKLNEEARKTKNTKKLKKLNGEIADVLEVAVKAGIGEDGYNAIVSACGQGHDINKADCNIVMFRVFSAIYKTVKDRKDEALNEKAAHYLSEAEDAQSKPDKSN